MVIVNDYYSQKNHGPYELYNIGDFELEEGGKIPECKLAYVTFGKLNELRDNTILMTTWYSGTSKIMEKYVGKGRALDPDKYFIVIVNQIGNGLSSSPHNTPDPYGMANFPRVRIGDDVRAQHKFLVEKFGIKEIALVVGGSMGAEQTWEWAVRYPDMVKRAAPIAGTAKTTPHDFLFAESLNEAIMSDPNWNNGNYKAASDVVEGLKRHAKIWAVMGWCTEFFKKESWREMGFPSVEEFMTGFMEPYFTVMDPNDLLNNAWKWQRGDVSRMYGGDLKKALGSIKAKVFVMPIDEDMFFTVKDCEYEQKMVPNSELRVIKSCGHLGLFAVQPDYLPQIDKNLRELLSIRV